MVNNGRSLLMRPAASGRARGRAGGQACPLVPRCALRYARRCAGRRATAHRLEPDPCRHPPRCGAPRAKVPTDCEPNAPDFYKPTECRRRCAGAGSQAWDGVYHDTRIYDHVWVYIHKYMDISMLVNSHHVCGSSLYTNMCTAVLNVMPCLRCVASRSNAVGADVRLKHCLRCVSVRIKGASRRASGLAPSSRRRRTPLIHKRGLHTMSARLVSCRPGGVSRGSVPGVLPHKDGK